MSDQAVGPALQILVTPLVLRWIGATEYGVWMLALTLCLLGPLTTFGASTAVIKHVSADLGTGERARAVSLVRAAVTVTLAGGGLLLLVAVVGSRLAAARFFSRMGDPRTVGIALAAGVLVLVLQELDGVFAGVLRGAQRFDLSAKVELGGRLAWAGTTLALARTHGTAAALLAGLVGLTALKLAVRAALASRLLSGDCWRPGGDRVQLRRVAAYGKWQWVQSVGVVLLAALDRLLVGSWFGAPELARYTICLQVAQVVHVLPSAAMLVAFPWISARAARGGLVAGRTLVRWALAAGSGCLVLPVVLVLASGPLLTLWLGAPFARDNVQLLQVLVVAYGLLALNVPTHYLLMGLGRIRFVSLSNLAAGLVTTAASLALAPFGLSAFAAAKIGYGPVTFVNFAALWKAGTR